MKLGKKIKHVLERRKINYLYSVGDLVELARFGFAPSCDEDRVFGTILSVLEPTDYFVPRYKVRIQYMKSKIPNAFDEYVLDAHEGSTATVMEYDIAGKIEEDSQA